MQIGSRTALLPDKSHPDRISFHCADAMEFVKRGGGYDVVLAANLLCRLKEPSCFLSQLKNVVAAGGQLILTAPYSWLEEYTSRTHWLGGEGERGTLGSLQAILNDDFELLRSFDMPFIIREHVRKFQWGVSQATIWRKRKSASG